MSLTTTALTKYSPCHDEDTLNVAWPFASRNLVSGDATQGARHDARTATGTVRPVAGTPEARKAVTVTVMVWLTIALWGPAMDSEESATSTGRVTFTLESAAPEI